jgi:hypothetical protein
MALPSSVPGEPDNDRGRLGVLGQDRSGHEATLRGLVPFPGGCHEIGQQTHDGFEPYPSRSFQRGPFGACHPQAGAMRSAASEGPQLPGSYS